MTQIYDDSGNLVPVTKLAAGPCFVSQIKTIEKDGYQAVQVAFLPKKKGTNSQKGHFKNIEGDFYQFVREFRVPEKSELEKMTLGQKITAIEFDKGEIVNVAGVSKGKGFQGVVKRHGFGGSLATHGHKDQKRMPGSIAAGGPARVFKGTRMGGRTGMDNVTVKNAQVVDIDEANGYIYVKGALPGARNGLIIITNNSEFKVLTEEKSAPAAKAEKSEPEKVEATAEPKVGAQAEANKQAAEDKK